MQLNHPGCILAPVTSQAELDYIKELADGIWANEALLGVFKTPLAAQECTKVDEDTVTDDCFEGWMTFEGPVPNDSTLWHFEDPVQPDGVGADGLVATIAHLGSFADGSVMFDSHDSMDFQYAVIKCYLDPMEEIRPRFLT